ncbi:MAG: NAD(P)-dependent oxidoreductase [Dehalococcoidia bacterium]|nr:MAG: NAD(P)-dependent oxidoreductase [Dehalococcoidia bacterium]
MRVLVTGGAGRLGVNVCNILLKEGFQVRVLDLDNERNRKSIRGLDKKAEIQWGDVTQQDSVREALEEVGLVVHMAGILPPVAYQKPELAHKVNVGGTRLLVDSIKAKGGNIPLIYTSSVAVFGPTAEATEPISSERNAPSPRGAYGETKLEAENLIKESGLDHLILRLTAVMYFTHDVSDLKRMFSVPLNNRIEFCHPDDLAVAILNSVKNIETIKGNTLVISGGPAQRMIYKDMVGSVLEVMGLPLPPADRFTKEPYYLDWYDTAKSQELLKFQRKSFADYLRDYSIGLTRRYTALFLPFMRYFVSPLFGKAVVQFM